MKKIIMCACLMLGTFVQMQAADKDNKVSLTPKVTGMVNLRYAYDESNKDQHGFDVRRVRLGVKGNLHEKLDYVMQAEYAGNVRLLRFVRKSRPRPELFSHPRC